MSVSLVSAPGNYQPASNPIEWKFSSTNVNECDFQYICDVYVNGDFVIRLREFPSTSNNYGVFRIERVLKDYLSFNFQPTTNDFALNTLGAVTYYVQIREKYDTSTDCSGTQTISTVQYTSAEKIAWNGALSYHDYLSYTQTKFVLTGRASRFLTNFKSPIKVKEDDYFTFSFLQGSTRVDRLQIETYNIVGTLIDTYYLTNPYSVATSPATDGDYQLTIGVGPENINNMVLDGSPAPSQPVINDTVTEYKVRMLNSSSSVISETKIFVIDTACYKYRFFRFWWLNRLGGFDSWNFHLKSVKTTEISRGLFTKILSSGYTAGSRGEGVSSVDARENISFTSDFLSQDESNAIQELFTSPEVYIYDNTPIRQKVEITGAVYNGGLADFVLTEDVILATGTTFTYAVDDGSLIGMASTGTGTITGYNSSSGVHTTNVVASINAGALITGYMDAVTESNVLIPVVVTTTSVEEKLKENRKLINYNIEARPSYKLNIQTL